MKVNQFAAEMKSAIEKIRAEGTVAIPCDNLIAYLEDVQNSPAPEPTAYQIESALEQYRWEKEHSIAMFRSVIGAGQSAIKSSFLLNGGAAVALLAFIGHLAQFKPKAVPVFAESLLLFGFGVLAIVGTSGFTYLTQYIFASRVAWAQKAGIWTNIVAILLGLISCGLFTWGLYDAYSAFLHLE